MAHKHDFTSELNLLVVVPDVFMALNLPSGMNPGTKLRAMCKGSSGPAVGGNSDPPGEWALCHKGWGNHGWGTGRECLLRARRLGEPSGHEDHRGPQERDRAHNDAKREEVARASYRQQGPGT